eukprot:symbB.v1.2.018633.t1/scaffold1441.1/size118624/5
MRALYSPHGSDLTPFSFAGRTTQSPVYSPAEKKEEDKDDIGPSSAYDYSPGASIYSGAKSAYTPVASGRYTPTYTPMSGAYAPKSGAYTPSAMSPYSPYSRKSPYTHYTPMSSQYGAASTPMRTPGTSPRMAGPTPGSGYSPSIAPASVAPSTARSVDGGISPIIEAEERHALPVRSPGYDAVASPAYTPVEREETMSVSGPAASAETVSGVTEMPPAEMDDAFEDEAEETAAYQAPEAEE